VYYPRLRDRRIRRGRRVELRPALFPGYAFVLIRLQQWYAARWAPGTLGLIMDGVGPAKVPDAVIAEIRRREVDGLIELAPAGRDPAAATRRRAEGDARQEGHRSGTLTRSTRSANSSSGAAGGCSATIPRRQQISDANGHGVLRSILEAAVHYAARRCGGRVGSLLEVGRELVSTGVLCRKVSSSICLTRKSATSAREMNPQVQSRGSTNAR